MAQKRLDSLTIEEEKRKKEKRCNIFMKFSMHIQTRINYNVYLTTEQRK